MHRRFALFRDLDDRPTISNCFLIIDEASTIPSDLLNMVLQQVREGVRVLFIGDADQLPPVGRGEPFIQIMESGIPVSRLKTIHRNDGVIARACRSINEGRMPVMEKGNDNFFLISPDQNDIPARILHAEDYFVKQGWTDAQIITPLNSKGGVGRRDLNLLMQNKRNMFGEEIPFTSIRVGDKVVQLRNNRDLYVFNGMTGKCIKRSDESRMILEAAKKDDKESLLFAGTVFDETHIMTCMFDEEQDDTAYYGKHLKEIDLGYAITVHKSQGNQFDYVFVVIPSALDLGRLAMRQIIYTAASRAKKKLVIFAVAGALEKCIANEDKMRRYSNLSAFIKESDAEEASFEF
jgi:exodeoxyribonuclease V alpha subunit